MTAKVRIFSCESLGFPTVLALRLPASAIAQCMSTCEEATARPEDGRYQVSRKPRRQENQCAHLRSANRSITARRPSASTRRSVRDASESSTLPSAASKRFSVGPPIGGGRRGRRVSGSPVSPSPCPGYSRARPTKRVDADHAAESGSVSSSRSGSGRRQISAASSAGRPNMISTSRVARSAASVSLRSG
jgi:hypothetical protein